MGCIRRAGNQQELEPRELPVRFIAVQLPVVDDSLWPGASLNIPSAATLLAARRGRPVCPRPGGFVQHLHERVTWAG